MKIPKKIKKCLIALLCIFIAVIAFADRKVENIESIIIESFDNEPGSEVEWIVRASKFIHSLDYSYVNSWPEALFGKDTDTSEKKSLGIKASFKRKGYNYLEIIPVTVVDGKNIPKALELPGKVKSIDLWVWGSNYNFYMEVHLIDIYGINHVLFFGNLFFQGWNNLSVEIPNRIPQIGRRVSENQQLQVTKFVIWTQPHENVKNFYVFIDHLRILTDTFIDIYDGDELADEDYLNEMWKSLKGGS